MRSIHAQDLRGRRDPYLGGGRQRRRSYLRFVLCVEGAFERGKRREREKEREREGEESGKWDLSGGFIC